MNTTILRSFANIPYFSIEAYKQVSGMESVHTTRVLLHRWSRAGHILPLKKGIYMTREFYEQHRGDAAFPLAVSAILVPKSYVSLEYILQQHNLLTEVTYPVTCITDKNTRTITNAIGTFWYRSLRPQLYTGFSIAEYYGIRYGYASLAKALFDYLYLRPIPPSYRSKTTNLAAELRLNVGELDQSSWDELGALVDFSASRKMKAIYKNLEIHR